MEASEKQDVVFLELRERLQSGLLIIRSVTEGKLQHPRLLGPRSYIRLEINPSIKTRSSSSNLKSRHEQVVFRKRRLGHSRLTHRTDLVKDASEVNVCSGASALKIHIPDGIYEVKLPPEVSLMEGSCQKSPELNVDGLHVRVRLKVGQCSEAQDSPVQQLRAQRSYCFLCQSCGAMLLKDRVFRRVLPLPNGNWNTLVDDWCCHPDPFANKKLLPQQEDCLLGDTYFLLTRDRSYDQILANGVDSSDVHAGSNLHSGKQPPGHRNVVVCKNCSAVLGEAVTTEVLQLYITEVVVRQSQDGEFAMPQNRQQFLERALGSRLVELSSAQSIFRFSIQTPDGKAVIMLWLLNMDTLMASFSEKAISSDILVSASDRHPDKHQSRQAVRAIKVLYLPCSHGQQDEAVDAWEKDISVHPLILPRSTCEEVLRLLNSSTKTLPSSLRSMNCYQVAYLRR